MLIPKELKSPEERERWWYMHHPYSAEREQVCADILGAYDSAYSKGYEVGFDQRSERVYEDGYDDGCKDGEEGRFRQC